MDPEISLFFKTLYQEAIPLLRILIQFFSQWWWFFLPFILVKPFLYFWLWWRNELWLTTKYRPILVEIKIPKEIVKPIRAMENTMAALHGVIYQPPDWWEKWIEGQVQTSLSFEIVSINGEIHFFLRFNDSFRQAVEAAIYSQFPEAEIVEAEDYTRKVPFNIPNENWRLWGTDYRLIKPNPYPIKTYLKFETEQEKEPEKIVDPVANLLEGLSKIKKGEQFWIQIRARPIGEEEAAAFVKEGLEIRDKLVKRPPKPKPKSFFQELIDLLTPDFLLPSAGKKEEKTPEIIPPEMKLTPGEREIVSEIERKISKPAFRCGIRFIYLGKKEVFFTTNFRLGFNFFNCYVTANLNALYPWGATLTKIHKSWFLPINLLRPRRDYLRRRKIFRQYKDRANTLFPRTAADKGIFILNTEELASLFHFPSWRVAPAPGLPRIETKKRPPPIFPSE